MNGACSIVQGNEEAKPAEQFTESKGTVDAFKTASTAHLFQPQRTAWRMIRLGWQQMLPQQL